MTEHIEIPKGWKLVSIPDVIGNEGIFVDGDWIESKDQDPNGEVRLIQLADIGDGYFRNKSSRYLTLKRAQEIKCTFLRNGDIIIARMPDPIGRACIFPLKGEQKFVTAVDVAIVRPDKENIDGKYLLYSINNPQFRNAIEALQSGTTRKRISRKNLATLLFPLPPKQEQQLIVSKIDELFSELDKGIECLKTAQQQLKVYRQAVLNAGIPEAATNTIESVIEKLDQGWSPKCYNEASKDYNQWAVIKTTAVQAGYFLDSENKILPENLKPRQQHELKKGDLLITRAGPRIRVGICCLVKHTRPKLLNCDKVYRIRIKSELAHPEYVELLLNSPKYTEQIEQMKTGISDSGVNLTQKGFLKIKIPLPSLVEQEKLVQETESRLSVCDKIEETINNALLQAEALRQSILKKAFEGKLV